MPETYLILLESAIFFVLAGLHWSWALGSKWGFGNTLPTNEKGQRVLNPKKTDSAMVALGLLLFALFYLIKGNLIYFDLPDWVTTSMGWIISSIFIIRAIGDFKYVGFFKSYKASVFAKADTRFYSPLCLLIGLVGISLELIR